MPAGFIRFYGVQNFLDFLKIFSTGETAHAFHFMKLIQARSREIPLSGIKGACRRIACINSFMSSELGWVGPLQRPMTRAICTMVTATWARVAVARGRNQLPSAPDRPHLVDGRDAVGSIICHVIRFHKAGDLVVHWLPGMVIPLRKFSKRAAMSWRVMGAVGLKCSFIPSGMRGWALRRCRTRPR